MRLLAPHESGSALCARGTNAAQRPQQAVCGDASF